MNSSCVTPTSSNLNDSQRSGDHSFQVSFTSDLKIFYLSDSGELTTVSLESGSEILDHITENSLTKFCQDTKCCLLHDHLKSKSPQDGRSHLHHETPDEDEASSSHPVTPGDRRTSSCFSEAVRCCPPPPPLPVELQYSGGGGLQ